MCSRVCCSLLSVHDGFLVPEGRSPWFYEVALSADVLLCSDLLDTRAGGALGPAASLSHLPVTQMQALAAVEQARAPLVPCTSQRALALALPVTVDPQKSRRAVCN